MAYVKSVCLESIVRLYLTEESLGEKRFNQNISIMTLYSEPTIISSYILTFINDFSRYTWIYFLKHKDHVFEKFKEFRAFIEKQYGQLVKRLRFDNGEEYVSKAFESYLSLGRDLYLTHINKIVSLKERK